MGEGDGAPRFPPEAGTRGDGRDVAAFDIADVLDGPGIRSANAPVFRRIERTVEDARPTPIVLAGAWKRPDDPCFEARIKDPMLTMRKKNVAVLPMSQRPVT